MREKTEDLFIVIQQCEYTNGGENKNTNGGERKKTVKYISKHFNIEMHI